MEPQSSLSLLADLVNENNVETSLKAATDFIRKWSLGFNPASGYYEFKLRGLPNEIIFLNYKDMELTKQKYEEYEKRIRISLSGVDHMGSHKISFHMVDEQSIQSELLLSMKKLRDSAKLFVNNCRENSKVSFDYLNSVFMRIQKGNPIWYFTEPIEAPRLKLIDVPIQYETIEDEIETKVYLIPFMAGQGEAWVRSRDCGECGKLFFYKLDRARFCSKKCRMRANNKARSLGSLTETRYL